jgi:hypothetical protein
MGKEVKKRKPGRPRLSQAEKAKRKRLRSAQEETRKEKEAMLASRKKRRSGRPRLSQTGHTTIRTRNDLVKRIDLAIEKHSKKLGFALNRQQFIELLMTKWGDG